MTTQDKAQQAEAFAQNWAEKGDEKQHTQSFWITFLRDVVGVSQPEKVIDFEKRVKIDNIKYIDAYIAETRVAIEQKGAKIDLDKPEKQSDGEELTPFEQAKRYNDNLPFSEKCRWIVVCNFKEFRIHDMEQTEPAKHFETILLEELPKQYHRFQFLIDPKNENIRREEQISVEAGKLVDKLYQALLPQYKNPNETALRSLNILCVRIVFCLYAEDAGLFEKRTSFEDYIKSFNLPNVRKGMLELFKALDTQPEDRDQYDELLKPFPYVNGGLFKDEDIEIPNFTQEIVDVIVEQCAPFDWSEISPTIFGAVFESTLNPETRRSGGMHYTSVQNIHKVIDPLFLDDLQAEFEQICATKVAKQKNEALHAFQQKLGSLTFLDPACGSGNFLTETYLSLRRLENKIIKVLNPGQMALEFDTNNFIHVHINQFYGIEINDFAVTVAKTALWIAESQMVAETEKILSKDIDFLPLTTNAFIVEGNALRMDWATLKPLEANAMPTEGLFAGFATQTDGSEIQYDYIMGNPPFVGGMMMSSEQKKEISKIFENTKGIGEADYVAAWYAKASEFMQHKKGTKTAFVSTNSITQGEQPAIVWKYLFNKYKIQIDFAYRTFQWDSESSLKAHVHCVIIGFSLQNKASKDNHVSIAHSNNSPSNSEDNQHASNLGNNPNSPSKLEGGRGECPNLPPNNPKWIMNTANTKDLRRELRKNGTPAEAGLWKILKAKQVNGLQFRRQFSVNNYILDFYCPALRLAIELDGDYHYHGHRSQVDYERDIDLLKNYNIRVLRFENKIVWENPQSIVNAILQHQTDNSSPNFEDVARRDGEVENSSSKLEEVSEGRRSMKNNSLPLTPSKIEGELRHRIYNADGTVIYAKNINGYLLDASNIFVENRSNPLCDIPKMNFGNMPRDGGGFILTEQEKEELIQKEPLAQKWIHFFPGADEFINNKKRYCLWLVDASPAEIKKCPIVYKRVQSVREMRAASKAESTRKMAETPTRFAQITQPLGEPFIIVPIVSSERRKYIPMGFMDGNTIASNLVFIIPNATLYHFGVLTSSVHMAWMRAVCGRLKSDYRYSKDIVYNNFPWPFYLGEVAQINGGVKNSSSKLEEVSEGRRSMSNNSLPLTPSKIEGEFKAKIEATAQAILDARANYPDSSLADLYDELTMPADLRKAHQANDKAVMQAYGFDPKMPENEIVAELFKLYEDLTK